MIHLKKYSHWIIFFLLCALLLGTVIYAINGPLVSNVFCTMLGCLKNNITVVFSDSQQPASYRIEVDSPAGKQILMCPENQYSGKPDVQKVSECFPGGGRLPYEFDYPMEQVSVTVYVNGYKITKTLDPSHCKAKSPNGKGCLPTCCWATVEFNLSP